MIDCSRGIPYDNIGCGGGDEIEALKYAIKNPIMHGRDYPYLGTDQPCQY